jgi:hypothetical protein
VSDIKTASTRRGPRGERGPIGPTGPSGDPADADLIRLTGQTPGLTSHESASLQLSNGSLLPLDPTKGYTLVLVVVTLGTISGSQVVQSFRRMFAFRPNAGSSILVASGVPEQIGDVAAALWTITVSVGAGNVLNVVFSTDITTSATSVAALLELVNT